jgi:hypothetical protein
MLQQAALWPWVAGMEDMESACESVRVVRECNELTRSCGLGQVGATLVSGLKSWPLCIIGIPTVRGLQPATNGEWLLGKRSLEGIAGERASTDLGGGGSL